MKTGVVPQFRGEYYFLSNYFTSSFVWQGIEFKSAEQAFAYAKTYVPKYMNKGNIDSREAILAAETPGEAKKLGRSVNIVVDEWDKRKVNFMRDIVHSKFSTGKGDLVGKLLNTGSMMLVEGNDWNDTFWGRCNGKGFNTLGVILMEERGYWRWTDFSKPPWRVDE